MSIEHLVFFIMAVIALGGALGVVTSRNLFHSALLLVLSFGGVIGFYVLLEAGFLAAVQLLIYVGAIAVLILFAIMLSRGLMDPDQMQRNEQWWVAALVSGVVGIALIVILLQVNWPIQPAAVPGEIIAQIGRMFLGSYVIPFVLISLLLLVALVGAIILARETE